MAAPALSGAADEQDEPATRATEMDHEPELAADPQG